MTSICPTITQTLAQTLTYCGHCPGGLYSPPAPTIVNPTSTYTTTVSAFCSTGLGPATYTVYQACPCKASHPAAPPPGFTTTVATCTTCGSSPITATLTVPGSEATCHGAGCAPIPAGGASTNAAAPPPAPPAETNMGSSPGAPAGGSEIPVASRTAVPSPNAPGAVSQNGDHQPQAPTSAAGGSGPGSSPSPSPGTAATPSQYHGTAEPALGSPKRVVLGLITFVMMALPFV